MIKKQDADEIETLYRDAKNKRNELDILADLYPVYSTDEIEKLLLERGYTIPRTRKDAKAAEQAQDTAKSAIPEAVLEAVRNSMLEVSSKIDDYQNQLAEINDAMLEQQAKLKELDGFLKLHQKEGNSD